LKFIKLKDVESYLFAYCRVDPITSQPSMRGQPR
jgi:hypothetical protein